MAASAGLAIGSLASCATLPVYKTTAANNKVSVPLTLFAQSDLQIIQAQGLHYNIALQKDQDGTYSAFLLRCTHADNPLISTGKGYVCNLHGSTFDKKGQVTKGPAERDLKKYSTEILNDQIIIHIG